MPPACEAVPRRPVPAHDKLGGSPLLCQRPSRSSLDNIGTPCMSLPHFAIPLFKSMLRVTGAVMGVIALLAVALLVITTMPGQSHTGPLPPLKDAEQALAGRLRGHVTTIGSQEHNVRHPEALDTAARYLESQLASYGYKVQRQEFEAEGVMVRNLQVTVPSHTAPGQRVIVVGGHYDSAPGTPGANDNASGTAAVLELARSLKTLGEVAQSDVMFVLYTNEEPPYFHTRLMGSQVHAKALKAQGVEVTAMLSLETMGYYSDQKGSQKYPSPLLNPLYPSEGNFIGFIATPQDLGFLRRVVRSFRTHTAFPSQGIAAPRFVPGIDYSDHASYIDQGYPALMVTDTAPLRYPHYHSRNDTPDKLNYERLARVVTGLELVIRELALTPTP